MAGHNPHQMYRQTDQFDPRRGDAWQDEAVCGQRDAGDDSLLFVGGKIPMDIVKRLVTTYCNRCPVKRECLAWAENDEHFVGVAGGKLMRTPPLGRRPSRADTLAAVAAAEKEYEEWRR